ncbi:hypothetical protein TIFTF001_012988 [Ficus carica]|uniref:Uncharacterized protein n=1 Tax=Ficus carica TaxID=3494 RepID=A0AA88ADC9_FICCA|nr:hypothetical protein TIFTF001_012988 [Ficus carica]
MKLSILAQNERICISAEHELSGIRIFATDLEHDLTIRLLLQPDMGRGGRWKRSRTVIQCLVFGNTRADSPAVDEGGNHVHYSHVPGLL